MLRDAGYGSGEEETERGVDGNEKEEEEEEVAMKDDEDVGPSIEGQGVAPDERVQAQQQQQQQQRQVCTTDLFLKSWRTNCGTHYVAINWLIHNGYRRHRQQFNQIPNGQQTQPDKHQPPARLCLCLCPRLSWGQVSWMEFPVITKA